DITDRRIREAGLAQCLDVLALDRAGPERELLDVPQHRAILLTDGEMRDIFANERVRECLIVCESTDPARMSKHSEGAVVQGRDVSRDHLALHPREVRGSKAQRLVQLSDSRETRAIVGHDLVWGEHPPALDLELREE